MASDAKLLEKYPALQRQDLFEAWSYVAEHRQEIESQIADNEA